MVPWYTTAEESMFFCKFLLELRLFDFCRKNSQFSDCCVEFHAFASSWNARLHIWNALNLTISWLDSPYFLFDFSKASHALQTQYLAYCIELACTKFINSPVFVGSVKAGFLCTNVVWCIKSKVRWCSHFQSSLPRHVTVLWTLIHHILLRQSCWVWDQLRTCRVRRLLNY